VKNALEATGELVIVERPGATNLYFVAWKGVPLGPQGEYTDHRQGQHEPSCPALEMQVEAGTSLRARRRLFERQRHRLALALIKRDGYRCRSPGCDIREDLVIDHIVPLSKGGTDALVNLQWLCRPHNHVKADRDEEVPYAL
jgi:HNH endonuclease